MWKTVCCRDITKISKGVRDGRRTDKVIHRGASPLKRNHQSYFTVFSFSLSLSLSLFHYLFVFLFISLSLCLSTSPSICLSFSLSSSFSLLIFLYQCWLEKTTDFASEKDLPGLHPIVTKPRYFRELSSPNTGSWRDGSYRCTQYSIWHCRGRISFMWGLVVLI